MLSLKIIVLCFRDKFIILKGSDKIKLLDIFISYKKVENV